MPSRLSHTFSMRQGLSDSRANMEIVRCNVHVNCREFADGAVSPNMCFTSLQISRFPIKIRDFEKFDSGTDFGKGKPACGRQLDWQCRFPRPTFLFGNADIGRNAQSRTLAGVRQICLSGQIDASPSGSNGSPRSTAIRQPLTIRTVPASVVTVSVSSKNNHPAIAAQMNIVYSIGSSTCASARA